MNAALKREGPAPVAAGREPDTEVHRIPEIPLPSEPGKAVDLPFLASAHDRRLLAARVLIERMHGGRT